MFVTPVCSIRADAPKPARPVRVTRTVICSRGNPVRHKRARTNATWRSRAVCGRTTNDRTFMRRFVARARTGRKDGATFSIHGVTTAHLRRRAAVGRPALANRTRDFAWTAGESGHSAVRSLRKPSCQMTIHLLPEAAGSVSTSGDSFCTVSPATAHFGCAEPAKIVNWRSPRLPCCDEPAVS